MSLLLSSKHLRVVLLCHLHLLVVCSHLHLVLLLGHWHGSRVVPPQWLCLLKHTLICHWWHELLRVHHAHSWLQSRVLSLALRLLLSINDGVLLCLNILSRFLVKRRVCVLLFLGSCRLFLMSVFGLNLEKTFELCLIRLLLWLLLHRRCRLFSFLHLLLILALDLVLSKHLKLESLRIFSCCEHVTILVDCLNSADNWRSVHQDLFGLLKHTSLT